MKALGNSTAKAATGASTRRTAKRGSTRRSVGATKPRARAKPKAKAAGASAKRRPARSKATSGSRGKSASKSASKPAPLPTDPWAIIKSPYGGKLSPNDQWVILSSQDRLARPRKHTVLSTDTRAACDSEHRISGGVLDQLLRAKPDARAETTAESESGAGVGAAGAGIGAGAGAGGPDVATATATAHAVSVEVSLRSADIASIDLRNAECLGSVVGLDVTDNRLSEAAVLRLGPNWLRRLVVGANCITSFPAFSQADWPVLLELDLSRNALASLSQRQLRPLAGQLRSLNLAQCGIETLRDEDKATQSIFQQFDSLQHLDISGNKLGHLAELRLLTCMKRLTHLHLLRNPWDQVEGFADALKATRQKLSCLRQLNGRDAALCFADGVDMLADAVDRSLTIGCGAGDDSASCSCVEGNPCAVPYACKDWDNRFTVARRAREEKYDLVF